MTMNVYILMETECRTIIGIYEKEEDAIAAAQEEARTCKYIEDGWENTFHIDSEVLHESSKKQELIHWHPDREDYLRSIIEEIESALGARYIHAWVRALLQSIAEKKAELNLTNNPNYN